MAHTLFYVGEGDAEEDRRYAATFFNQSILTFQPPIPGVTHPADDVPLWLGMLRLLGVIGLLCFMNFVVRGGKVN